MKLGSVSFQEGLVQLAISKIACNYAMQNQTKTNLYLKIFGNTAFSKRVSFTGPHFYILQPVVFIVTSPGVIGSVVLREVLLKSDSDFGAERWPLQENRIVRCL